MVFIKIEDGDCEDRGLAIIVMKEKKVLMGLRKGSYGSGSWAFPGGHQRLGESVIDSAKRELNEEVYVSVSFMDEALCIN